MKVPALKTFLGEWILVLFVFALLDVGEIEAKKMCKVQKDAFGTYSLICENKFDERTITTNRKEKKARRKGPPGERGPVGPPGKDGNEGQTGPEGPMGPIGPTGVPGPRGHTGKTGPKGKRGDSGPMGAQGKPGLPGNCLKNPPKFSRELNQHYHCLAGPEGPQGRKGDTGSQGESGPMGIQGEKGDPGKAGARGRRGPVGMPGLPGTAGNISCEDHYTPFLTRYSEINGGSFDGFLCPTGEFLQGFRREVSDLQERYRYICCKIS